jgi:hypothetical protein
MVMPNDQDKLPGRLQQRLLSKSRDAGPVNFIASLGASGRLLVVLPLLTAAATLSLSDLGLSSFLTSAGDQAQDEKLKQESRRNPDEKSNGNLKLANALASLNPQVHGSKTPKRHYKSDSGSSCDRTTIIHVDRSADEAA